MSTIQRALLVDPSQDSRARMQHILSKAPLFVVAETGYGARANTIAASKRPAVVLMAMEVPLERALHTLHGLRVELPDAMIVAYTSNPDRHVVKESMRADAVLAAPVDADELMGVLHGRTPAAAQSALPADAADAGAPHARLSKRTRGEVLAVFSIKGGVGASTIAGNIATAIGSQTGARVLAIDLDLRFGDLATLLDLEPEFSLADLAEIGDLDRENFARAVTTHASAVDFLCAPAQPSDWRPVAADRLRTIIEFAAKLYDYVILDVPSTLDDVSATAIELAGRTLLVSSFDRTSVYATARLAGMLRGPSGATERVRLVLNEVQEERVIEAETIREVVGHEIYATIPFDPVLVQANQSGQPVVTASGRSRAALALHALAGDLAGYVPQAEPAAAWDRVIGWANGREPVRAARRDDRSRSYA